MSPPDELPKRLSRVVIYESPWVNLYRDKVVMPNGHVIGRYHLVDLGRGAVAVIVENSEGRILMERVARHATGSVTWELPAGGIEEGEPILEAAGREVREETGYDAHDFEHLYVYNPLNGISNMKVHVVRCKAAQRGGSIDENEIQGVRWFSVDELGELIRKREITDGLALTGLLLHLNARV